MLRPESIAGTSKPTLVSSRRTLVYQDGDNFGQSPDRMATADLEGIYQYFMSFWQAPSAVRILDMLYELEKKRGLKPLHEQFGHWCPPAEVVQALKNPSRAPTRLFDSKEAKNIKLVLKVMGCSLHENRPYKQFIKAKSLRQKRLWMYQYMPSKYDEVDCYCEPICATRLKRLWHFFPNRFSEQDGTMLFNHKPVTYDQTNRVFYIGRTADDDDD